jgi:hypothetical protein
MKHLKTFENNDMKFEIGDIIVLMSTDEENKSLLTYFEIGKLYKIEYIDDAEDDSLPYRIVYIDDSEYSAWVEGYRIRLAEPWEIDQNKYNL